MSLAHSQVHQNPRSPTHYGTSGWAIASKHFILVELNALIHTKVINGVKRGPILSFATITCVTIMFEIRVV